MDEETPLVAEHSDSETLTKSLLVDILGSWCCPELGEYYQNYNVFDKSSKFMSVKILEKLMSSQKEPIPVTELVRKIAVVMQEFTQSG